MSSSQQLTIPVPEELLEEIARRIANQLEDQRSSGTATPTVSPWLTLQQACDYLGLSKDSLYKLTAARAIPFRKKQGGQGLRFHRDELDQWMQTQYPRLDRLD